LVFQQYLTTLESGVYTVLEENSWLLDSNLKTLG
jgi:hypothetical protein